MPTAPCSLRTPEAIAIRSQLLTHPDHVPLRQWIEQLQESVHEQGLDIPHFDPIGGGVRARVLYLLEAPGPKAARQHGGSGFISMDNNDPTAKNVFTLTQEAGLDRRWVLAWNIVPWYVGTGDKIRPVKLGEVIEGQQHLRELISLLPDLRVVVTMGMPARKGWTPLAGLFPQITTLTTWHPSGQSLNPSKSKRTHVRDTLRLAGELAAYRFDPNGPK